MARYATDTVIWPDLREHPAVHAWRELRADRTLPEEIEILKTKHKQPVVFRLSGVGPKASAVIAKRCKRDLAIKERTIYEEILPHLPVSSPGYFGLVEEPDGKLASGDIAFVRLTPLFPEDHKIQDS